MKKFHCVEDYIEIIAGYRSPAGNLLGLFNQGPSPLNLARYDVEIVGSMAQQIANGTALTERQADLACKIVLKYERQLAKLGIDVSPVEKPQWRIPLRKMDYSRRLSVEDDLIKIRFPFKIEWIEQLREFAKSSQGSCVWNKEQKAWQAALTEYNLNWLITWVKNLEFEIDDSVTKLFDLIQAVEQQDYRIQLTVKNGHVEIENCPGSLRQYIDTHIGGFTTDNLVGLADNAAVLGYGIDDSIKDALIKEYGFRFFNILNSREIKINPSAQPSSGDDFSSVLDYVDHTKRWPCVFFEPDLSGFILSKLIERYGPDWNTSGRYIYATKPVRDLPNIPIVVTTAGMIFGGDRQLMLQRAEKIVYCCADVYNKGKQGRKVKSIAG